MFAGEWSVLQKPNSRVVGPNGVLEGGTGGAAVVSPTALAGTEAWYDIQDPSSMVIDGSNRVSLVADKSGNSAENCLILPGVIGNYASAPDSAAISAPTQLDVMVDFTPTNKANGASQFLLGQYGISGDQRSWYFGLSASGKLRLIRSQAGTSTVANVESAADWPYANLVRGQARLTWDSTTGDVSFYYRANDSESWTLLETQLAAATGPAFNSTANLTIGADSDDSFGHFSGNIYRAAFSKTIDGAYVFDADFTAQSKLATSFTESSSNAATVTINQTAIALPARIHGARDRYQGVAANQPVYLPFAGEKYGYLNGVTGNYFSTPDSAALDITGDISVAAYVESPTWESTAFSRLVSKEASTTNTSYAFGVSGAGAGLLGFVASFDGTLDPGNIIATSTEAVPFSNNEGGWVRVSFDVDNGAGGNTVTFYTSSDSKDTPISSVSWQQLGDAIVTAGTFTIYSSTAAVNVGARNSGASGLFSGKIYRASIISGGIDGTVVADLNAEDYTSGRAFVSSETGETWTLQGGSVIVDRTQLYYDGSNDYMQTSPFPLEQPESVYFAGSQITWTDFDSIYDGNAILTMAFRQQGTSPAILLNAGGTGPGISPSLGQNFVAASVFNGASSSNRLNLSAANTGNAGTNDPNGFIVGARADGRYSNITEIGIIIRSTADDAATQARFIRYLAQKGGISV